MGRGVGIRDVDSEGGLIAGEGMRRNAAGCHRLPRKILYALTKIGRVHFPVRSDSVNRLSPKKGPLAQRIRAPGYGPGGQRFKSFRAHFSWIINLHCGEAFSQIRILKMAQERALLADIVGKGMHTSLQNGGCTTLGQGAFLVVFIPLVFGVMLSVFALCFLLSLVNRTKMAFA